MAKPAQTFNSMKAILPLAMLMMLMFSLSLSGCANKRFRAEEVPDWAIAPPRTNVQQTGLQHLNPPAFDSQMVAKGDVLEVTIVTDFGDMKTMTTPVRIDRNGMADVPLIGQVRLAGFQLEEAGGVIVGAAVARGIFRQPHVTVTMKRKRTNQITVMGAVEEPGVIELPSGGSSILTAIISAGGLTEDAGDEVIIRRPSLSSTGAGVFQEPKDRVTEGPHGQLMSYQEGAAEPPRPRITRINLSKEDEQPSSETKLGDGDVVRVTRRVLEPVSVIGLVKNQGEYELSPNHDMYLLKAISNAGGLQMEVADKVVIIRRVEGKDEPIYIDASIAKAKKDDAANIRLAPGDIVSVEETPVTVVVRTLRDVIRVTLGGSAAIF